MSIRAPTKGFRKIENDIFEAITAARLTGAGYAVLLVIIGRTLGFRKGSEYRQQAPISLGYMQESTRLSRQSVLKGIRELEERHIILPPVREATKKTVYGLNPSPDEWLPRKHDQPQLNSGKLVSDLSKPAAVHMHTEVMVVNQITPEGATESPYTSKATEGSLTFAKETLKETLKENNDLLSEVPLTNKKLRHIVRYYLKRYLEFKGYPHPNLKPDQWNRVVATLESFDSDWCLSLSAYKHMIDYHFERKLKTDYNINHFTTEGILLNLFYKRAYYA